MSDKNLERIFLFKIYGDEMEFLIELTREIYLEKKRKISGDEKEMLKIILSDIINQLDNPVNALEIHPN